MLDRALAGRLARKCRHVLAGALKGLNFVVTSVICLVIIFDSNQGGLRAVEGLVGALASKDGDLTRGTAVVEKSKILISKSSFLSRPRHGESPNGNSRSSVIAQAWKSLNNFSSSSPSQYRLEMSAQNISSRLTTLFNSLKQTQQLITRLSKLPAQPGASPSNPEDGDVRVELSAEIHQSLKEQEEDYELVRQEAEDLTNSSSWSSAARRRDSGRERERTDLASQVTRLGEGLKMYHTLPPSLPLP